MTDSLQPGLHLDADQLSAFAEGALPAHERESTLAHLAVCPGCREMLALAMPEDAAEPLPGPAKAWWPRWLPGWNLVWPGAGALAAIVLVTVVLTHPHPAMVAPVQTARVGDVPVLPSPLAAEPRESAPPKPVSAKPAPPPPSPAKPAPAAPAKAAIVLGREQVVVADAQASVGPLISQQKIEDLPLNGRNSTFLQQAPAPAQIHGSLYRALPPGLDGQTQAGLAQGQGMALPVQRGAGPSQQSQQTAVYAPAPPPAAAAAGAAAPAYTLRMNLPALPSGKAIGSSVSARGATVAVDTDGAVFVSTDSGKHWTAVRPAWSGRALSVGYVVPASPPKPAGVLGGLAPLAGMASVSGAVVDPTGVSIPKAVVTLTGGINRTITADGTGHFTAQGLPPGPYAIDAEYPGFERYNLLVTLSAGMNNLGTFALHTGVVTDAVTVDTTSAEIVPEVMRKRVVVAPVFEVRMEDGARWVSSDGVIWSPVLR